MSIGLYDADFFTYHQTIFNLELMKLATYFKRKREITIMAPSFVPEKYTHFFYRKDFNDGNFPSDLSKYKNLTYGGLAFTNNKHVPLKEEIECCPPDLTIYERYKDLFIENDDNNKRLFTSLINGVHFRLSLNNQTIWELFEKQIPASTKGRIFFLHDYNLNNIEHAPEAVQFIIRKYQLYNPEKKEASLCVKFPIECNDFDSFYKWLGFIFSHVNFSIQYNGMLTDEQINQMVNKINHSKTRKIIYNPLPFCYNKEDFLEEDLIKIFTQVLFLYKNQKQVSLICNDDFTVPDEIKKMFLIFTRYGRVDYPIQTSLYHYVKRIKKEAGYYSRTSLPIKEIAEVFYYVQKNYPNLFKLFYEVSGASYKGGKIIIEQ